MQIQSLLKNITLIFVCSASLAFAQPPEKVPSGLSSGDYLKLGKEYKQAGWTEQAREALQRCIKADPSGVGKPASIFLRCYLPRYPAPRVAVQANIVGYNKLVSGDLKGAEQEFKDCSRRYPKFEWPLANLGALYAQQKKPKEAIALLKRALLINPDYVNAWMNLASAHLAENDIKSADMDLNSAYQSDPSNREVQAMRAQVARLMKTHR